MLRLGRWLRYPVGCEVMGFAVIIIIVIYVAVIIIVCLFFFFVVDILCALGTIHVTTQWHPNSIHLLTVDILLMEAP